ncbi:charged multivesicular body protein 7 isoform X1 [Rhinatrema bivittatum]|uniref:charged multivesicular body protein 7 isoform X1 n=1 Tax=Rhinatrema bivittatum TaxID=194408 RepID=UPI00112A2A4B|nr:charged multivesicular body protein 7 isoform X1 [Rhinatrema bivittatum]
MLACPQKTLVQAALPPEWQDDERMAFLFSAFKQNREVNRSDWDSKMAFWAPLVVSQSRQKEELCFTLKELQKSFQRKGSIPLGLGTVIEEMLRHKKLQRESEFVASVNSGWISWGVGLFVVKPLQWTLSTVLGGSKVPTEEVFVVPELLKEKADGMWQLFQNSSPSSQSVVSMSELRSLCASLCPDERMFCLVLLQLQKEKRVMVLEKNGEKIVKFARGPHETVSPVNDVDMGVYQLMQSEKLLQKKVEMLSLQVERSKEEARSAYRLGKKQQALRSLKSKKRTEKRLGELQAKLECVQGILDRISASQTDRMVVDAYQAGVAALKLAMKDVTVQKAESLVEQIQEYCDTQEDITQALTGLEISSLDVDTEELEQELNFLLSDSTNESPELPNMPRTRLPSPPGSFLPDFADTGLQKPSPVKEGLKQSPGSTLSKPRWGQEPVVE